MVKKIQLGEFLVENEFLTQAQLNEAIDSQKKSGEKLGRIIIDMGFLTEEKLLEVLSQQLNIPFIDLKDYALTPDTVRTLPEVYARRFRAMVLNNTQDALVVGMADPLDLVATDELRRILKRPFQIALVREEDLMDMIDMMYRHSAEISNLAGELSAELKIGDFDVSQLAVGLSTSDAPVVKLLQTIFEDAVQVDASDIHIEPDENILRIRVRIDGVLHEQIVKEANIAQALTLRLKLMGGLNIAEKRLPQDGRFSIKIKNKNFDVRLSTMPVQFGESVVMRLLNHSAELLRLEQLGMPENILVAFRKALMFPNGLILITGPTGSGKTTTLYGGLNELNTEEVKIITVEDPVEYRLPRISQVQVQPKIELTFARVLRSALRQDPDIIMVGELRDRETASVALRAALTGHLVLTTLHTNDTISSVVRLVDMGAEDYLVATALRAVMAQRLVRKICENCSKPYKPTDHEIQWLIALGVDVTTLKLKKGTGCTYCHKTGYRGQNGVYEFLEITPALADAIRQHKTHEFTLLAEQSPTFKSLMKSGLELILRGVTTISEVIRIAGEEV